MLRKYDHLIMACIQYLRGIWIIRHSLPSASVMVVQKASLEHVLSDMFSL